MESVSCHQKGLVMGNILWSVDKKIYSDKEDHTLAITGWAITRDQSECDFILYGSGKELSVPEPSRCERADVAKDLYKLFVVWFVVIGKGNQPGDHKSRNGGEHHREEEDPVAHQIAQKA